MFRHAFGIFAALSICFGQADVLAATCKNPAQFEQTYQQFLADARSIATRTSAEEDLQLNAALNSLQSFEGMLASATQDGREQLCELFERQPILASAVHIARGQMDTSRLPSALEQSRSQSRAPGVCLSTDQYLAAFAIKQVLDAAATVADAACAASECSGVPVPPVCVAPSPCAFACPISAVAAGLAQATDAALTLDDNCRGNKDDAAREALIEDSNQRHDDINAEFENVLIPRWDVVISTRASAVKAADLDARLLNRITRTKQLLSTLEQNVETVGTTNTSNRTIEVRLSTELSLLGAGGGSAALQLPQAAGGQLERVREVVAEAIVGMQSIGEPVATALALFAEGDASLNKGDFVSAFAKYQAAYKSASAIDGARR